jgi:hypothetical protein
MDLLSASVGPLTGAIETVAASIGSGAVIGGFFGGIEGGLLPRPRNQAERNAVIGTYVGGFVALAFLGADILRERFV